MPNASLAYAVMKNTKAYGGKFKMMKNLMNGQF